MDTLNPARVRELLRRWRLQRLRDHLWSQLETVRLPFAEQRAAWSDDATLVAILCGRRSGKTKGGCEQMVVEAATTPGGRFLYLNSTREECLNLAWHGLRLDGMASLVQRLTGLDGEPLNVVLNESRLTIHFPDVGSWIFLKGADDEKGVRKRLGLAYHRVWWDEAQKIPTKLSKTVNEVLMPALLDFKGAKFTITGTPVRQMSGLFFDATFRDLEKRFSKWALHQWNLLANPAFGATVEERMQNGMLKLQDLYGGPDVVPLDSPLMMREGFGLWTHEDAAFTYAVHRAKHKLTYAPDRRLPTGFPDFRAALEDLPGWGSVEYFTGLGADIGYSPDPFAICAIAWNLHDECVYELGSWADTKLDSDDQAACLRRVREIIRPCVAVADAGGSARPAVAGWEKEWIRRYNIPIEAAQKAHKNGAIERYNADILRGRWKYREGSPLLAQLKLIQWLTTRSATGLLIEDPTIANDIADASVYIHRGAYHFRVGEEPPPRPPPGTPEALQREEDDLLEQLDLMGGRDYDID